MLSPAKPQSCITTITDTTRRTLGSIFSRTTGRVFLHRLILIGQRLAFRSLGLRGFLLERRLQVLEVGTTRLLLSRLARGFIKDGIGFFDPAFVQQVTDVDQLRVVNETIRERTGSTLDDAIGLVVHGHGKRSFISCRRCLQWSEFCFRSSSRSVSIADSAIHSAWFRLTSFGSTGIVDVYRWCIANCNCSCVRTSSIFSADILGLLANGFPQLGDDLGSLQAFGDLNPSIIGKALELDEVGTFAPFV